MVFTVPFVKTKSRFYKKGSPANDVFTPFAGVRLVPLTGLEPVRRLIRGILSPLCLPIPPQRHFQKKPPEKSSGFSKWLRRLDLNQRPSGYEPDELPSCSTPRYFAFTFRVLIYYITPRCVCQVFFQKNYIFLFLSGQNGCAA